MGSIYQTVEPYIKAMTNNKHDRFCAWEHCYSYFGQKHVDENIACLHLSAYLASFGMYTRKSLLMQHDYQFLKPVIEVLVANKQLRKEPITYSSKSTLSESILRIDAELNTYFQQEASETLKTKIIMGTLGILPAYDRYVKAGLKTEKYTQHFGTKSIEELFDFATNRVEEIYEAQVLIKNERSIEYPVMRVLDMYFWMKGKGKEKEEKKGGKR
jgi:hypothetical protein